MIHSRRGERGQDLVEFAIIMPVLLLLIFGIGEFAFVVFSYDTISDAAREAARYGAISAHSVHATGVTQTCVSPTNDIVERACRLAPGLEPASVRVTPSRIAGVRAGKEAVRVVVSYEASFFSGLFIAAIGDHSTLGLNAAATMQIE